MKAKLMALDDLLEEIMDQVTMPELENMINKKKDSAPEMKESIEMDKETESIPEMEDIEEMLGKSEDEENEGNLKPAKVKISLLHLGNLTKKPEKKLEKIIKNKK